MYICRTLMYTFIAGGWLFIYIFENLNFILLLKCALSYIWVLRLRYMYMFVQENLKVAAAWMLKWDCQTSFQK
jgi:hypothetical protein